MDKTAPAPETVPSARAEVERQERPPLTWKQLDVLMLAIERRGVTVREAKEALDEDLAYTSVLTICQTLEKNGYFVPEPEGRANRYQPQVNYHDVADAYARLLVAASPKLASTVRERIEAVEAGAAVRE